MSSTRSRAVAAVGEVELHLVYTHVRAVFEHVLICEQFNKTSISQREVRHVQPEHDGDLYRTGVAPCGRRKHLLAFTHIIAGGPVALAAEGGSRCGP